MTDHYSIAIILACYNRKEKTIKCVQSLIDSASHNLESEVTFYVWDDGSTDGTVEELERFDKRINVFRGPGEYYWSKSMFSAMKEAVRDNHDLYLMVNDDVVFFSDALTRLIEDYKQSEGKCGIVGSTVFDGIITYGGRARDYSHIKPGEHLKTCVYANWNCFMIDRYVVERVGLICEKYKHAGGDFDYSCRMNRKGIPQYIASDYVGECEIDHAVPGYLNNKISMFARLKCLFSPKGEPLGSFFRFHWADKRVKGIIIALYSYVLLVFKVVFLNIL